MFNFEERRYEIYIGWTGWKYGSMVRLGYMLKFCEEVVQRISNPKGNSEIYYIITSAQLLIGIIKKDTIQSTLKL